MLKLTQAFLLTAGPGLREKVAEGNLSFLRTDKAFDKAMEQARKKWKWEHLKLA